MLQLPAIPVAPGLAVGEAMVVRDLREGVERQPIDGQQVEAECLRVQDALEHVADLHRHVQVDGDDVVDRAHRLRKKARTAPDETRFSNLPFDGLVSMKFLSYR